LGQKVNPIGLRLNITRSWESIWYADKDYAANLHEDQQVRAYLKKRLYHAGISQIMVERTGDKVKIKLFAAQRRPCHLRQGHWGQGYTFSRHLRS
jgi:small subunit ribosomal protein S3